MQTKTTIFVPDIHVPHQDRISCRLVNNVVKEMQPDNLVFLGDILDCYAISKFDKNPLRLNSFGEEIKQTRELLNRFFSASPNSRKIIMEGNHEARIRPYLHKVPALYSLDFMTWRSILKLEDNVEFYNYGESINLDNLVVCHGARVRKFAGYTAHGEMGERFESGISGHTHRLAQVWRSGQYKKFHWVEAGCLCDIEGHDYLKSPPDWQLGFVIGYFHRGQWTLEPVPIHKSGGNRWAVIRGQEFRVKA